MRKTVWNLLRKLGLAHLLLPFTPGGYLRAWGWPRTVRTGRSTDAQGNPLAWYTYPCLHFLQARLRKDFDVFEYGAGASTFWYAARVGTVTAVEHDAVWFQNVHTQAAKQPNIQLMQRDAEQYAASIASTDRKYHLIGIDGIERVACVRHALQHLAPGGVLVLDNSDRAELYAEAFTLLAQAGYRRLDFAGMAPIVGNGSQTSIFYQPGNVLGI
jgi:precorrin-6B methylase 2